MPLRLLGRQVRQLALDDTDGRRRDAIARLGESEVDELRDPLPGEEDVCRVDVAVDHVESRSPSVSELVRVVERVGDASADPGDDLERQRFALGVRGIPELEERVSAKKLHHEEVPRALVAEGPDRQNVRVRQARRDARLVREHGHELLAPAVLLSDHLQRHQLRRLCGPPP